MNATDPPGRTTRRAAAAVFAAYLLLALVATWPLGSRLGDHILLAPPYNVKDEELEMIVDLLADTMKAVLAS